MLPLLWYTSLTVGSLDFSYNLMVLNFWLCTDDLSQWRHFDAIVPTWASEGHSRFVVVAVVVVLMLMTSFRDRYKEADSESLVSNESIEAGSGGRWLDPYNRSDTIFVRQL